MTGHCVVCMQTDADLVPWHANVQSCPALFALQFNAEALMLRSGNQEALGILPRGSSHLDSSILGSLVTSGCHLRGYPIYPTYIYIIYILYILYIYYIYTVIQVWLPSGYD